MQAHVWDLSKIIYPGFFNITVELYGLKLGNCIYIKKDNATTS